MESYFDRKKQSVKKMLIHNLGSVLVKLSTATGRTGRGCLSLSLSVHVGTPLESRITPKYLTIPFLVKTANSKVCQHL